jgi:hypothetical protein
MKIRCGNSANAANFLSQIYLVRRAVEQALATFVGLLLHARQGTERYARGKRR